MFENTLEFLQELQESTTYSMDILPDKDGYFDKECPNSRCQSKFKVNANDWESLFSEDKVFCPFCGHAAPADSWWTTEQIEQLRKQAEEYVEARLGEALTDDITAINRSFSKSGFIKVSLKISGGADFVDLPAEALEEMEQKITCEKCGARYAVIGSAFYCPCCGNNSAQLTFSNTIEKVKSKINHLPVIQKALEEVSKDVAARTCTSLIESSVSDLVVSLQRLCECIYPQLRGAKELKKNVFQRLDDGNKLWRELTGKGYDSWITKEQYGLLIRCFQQRHILQHKDGIVDQEYIAKSGDTDYQIGQHLIVTANDVLEYAEIIDTIGAHVISLADVKESEEKKQQVNS